MIRPENAARHEFPTPKSTHYDVIAGINYGTQIRREGLDGGIAAHEN
jgi:hypothetical protein